jgi:hypothetical protein
MDKKLHLLDSFMTQGSDGATYKVMAYEHLRRDDALNDGREHWEPTGQTEYRLASGEHLELARDGSLRVAASGLMLKRSALAKA